MQKNVAGQKIGAQLVSATDGSAFSGTVTVYVTGDAGTQAIGSVGSGVCTHEGNGYHTYAPSQAETNYDLIAFTFVGSGAVPTTVQVVTAINPVTAVPTAAQNADAVWDEAYSGHTTAGTFGKLLDIIRKSNLSIEGTVSTAISATTTTFSSDVSATTGAYEHAVLLFTSGVLTGENSPIISYNSTNGVFVLEEPLTTAPSDGDEFVVIAGSHVHSVAAIQAGLATTAGLTQVAAYVDTEVAAIKVVTDRISDMLILDGAVYQFTTNALERGPSGSTTVNVLPLAATDPQRQEGTTIYTYVGDTSAVTVSIYDANNDPVDLSGLDLRVTVEDRTAGTDLLNDETPNVQGASNNQVVFAPNSTSQATAGTYYWAVRAVGSGEGNAVKGHGKYIVGYAAAKNA